MLSQKAVGHVALAVLLSGLHGGLPHAQERAPILESVDLFVPMAPARFKIDGKTQIVHELHVTNFLPVDVSITRIQVKSAGAGDASMADFQGSDVSGRIGRPGLRRDAANPHVVGPGMRAVIYFWLALPEGAVAPQALTHRIELDVLRATGPVHAVVEGALSNVSTDSLVLDPPLRGGPWVAIYAPLLKGGHRTAIYTVGGRGRIPARFAIDWIRLPAGGALEPNTMPRPADWNGYGADVLAVADGVVAAAMDDIPENARRALVQRFPSRSKTRAATASHSTWGVGDSRSTST